MRRMAGLELDGWHDFACRGWQLDDEPATAAHAELVDGGYASVVVGHGESTIGGPQARLSPIGRGAGWGRKIGFPMYRRRIASQWSGFLKGEAWPSWPRDLRAAADALTRQAQDVVFCMPDRPEMDEARQQALLAALSGPHRPRVTLLWHPVAALLGWLETNDAVQAYDGMRVACLQHAADGLEIQVLTLRALGSQGGLLVPERAGAGRVAAPQLGLKALHDAAMEATLRVNALRQTGLLGHPFLPDEHLFAPCPISATEVFRLESGDWQLLQAPAGDGFLPAPEPCAELDALQADLVLLTTPLAGRHHAWLRAAFEPRRPLRIQAPGSAARGALAAARRIARGVPHYLDRLDQVALVVLRQGVPVFEDLIPADAIVAANREYVSHPITNMVWGPEMASAQFYLRKGTREIRRWITPEVPVPDSEQRLVIQLRQRPAQGWAHLSISSKDWDYLERNPIRLDWMRLEREERTEEEILASLSRPRPVVPQRLLQRPGLLPWVGGFQRQGLAAVLERFDLHRPGDLTALVAALRWTPKHQDGSRIRAVGSDGDLPLGLEDRSRLRLDEVAEALARYLERHVEQGREPPNNDALMALTWMFGRCPESVIRETLLALACALAGRDHVFLAPRAGITVVMHGAGRIIQDKRDLAVLIPRLITWLDTAKSLNNGLGLLATLLSRPRETPGVLLQLDRDKLSFGLLNILQRLTQDRVAGSRLKYALIAIAGLLRIREVEPWALVAGQSSMAASIAELLQQRTNYLREPRSKAAVESISELIKMLRGEGGRPDIFVVLDEIEDE